MYTYPETRYLLTPLLKKCSQIYTHTERLVRIVSFKTKILSRENALLYNVSQTGSGGIGFTTNLPSFIRFVQKSIYSQLLKLRFEWSTKRQQ